MSTDAGPSFATVLVELDGHELLARLRETGCESPATLTWRLFVDGAEMGSVAAGRGDTPTSVSVLLRDVWARHQGDFPA